MAAVIGSLRVVLGADTGSFEDGLKKAGASLVSFSKITAGVAAGDLLAKAVVKMVQALGDVVAATFHAIDAMDKMGKESQKLGVSVHELSKLSVASKLADVDLAELSKSVVQLSKRMVEGADSGTAPARRALTALGVSFKEFVALKPDQQMALLANRFSQFRDGADKTAAAVALFGRAGANLIPLLNEGAEGFRKAAEMASKLGLVLSKEASDAAQKFQDNMKLVGLALTQGVFNVIAEKILPVLVLLSEGLLKVTVGFMHMIGAGAKMDQVMEDLRKKMNMPTDEAARNAENFRKKIDELKTSALELGGFFASKFPAGFMQTAISLKLVQSDFFAIGTTAIKLTKDMELLLKQMLNVESMRLTQEFLTPWEQYEARLREITRIMSAEFPPSAETMGRAIADAADKAGLSFEKMGGNVANFAGSMSSLTKTLGKENRAMGIASKAFGIAQAIINTQIAITKALATLPPPASYAAVAAAVAAGASAVATIASQGFAHGGSFKVPGTGGGTDSMPVSFMATPGERVTVETPQQQRGGDGQTIVLKGSSFHFTEVRDLIELISAGLRDGHKLTVQRA